MLKTFTQNLISVSDSLKIMRKRLLIFLSIDKNVLHYILIQTRILQFISQ